MGEWILVAVLLAAAIELLHEQELPTATAAEPWTVTPPLIEPEPWAPPLMTLLPPPTVWSFPTRTSEAGLQLIRNFEGLRLSAYLDPGGVWTIGYGHTGADVHAGLTITRERAEELLRADVAGAEACVAGAVVVPLTQGQFDALVSFVFNLGCGNLQRSTLLELLNLGAYDRAAEEFGRWIHAGGVVLTGLVNRRAAELALFRAA